MTYCVIMSLNIGEKKTTTKTINFFEDRCTSLENQIQ